MHSTIKRAPWPVDLLLTAQMDPRQKKKKLNKPYRRKKKEERNGRRKRPSIHPPTAPLRQIIGTVAPRRCGKWCGSSRAHGGAEESPAPNGGHGIDPQASSVQVWHFPGLKLRLGGDALGADPTYLLYLPFRPHGGI